MLAALLAEIERSAAPLTPSELGRRLGVEPERIEAMLATLRAHGRLVPDLGREPADVCGGASACRGACPGPAECAMAAGPGLVPLQLVGRPDGTGAANAQG